MILPARTDDEKAIMLSYVASKIGTTPDDVVGSMPFTAMATVRASRVMGAVIYTNFRGKSIEMSCAGEPGWLSPTDLRSLFAYPFIQLDCFVIMTSVMRRNEHARKFNERLGFIHLGVVESGSVKGDDTMLYKMTRPQCRWIAQPKNNVIAFPNANEGVAAHG